MESVIAKLLQDFEQGKMNRRQLIQSLSLAAAAAGVAPAARAAGKPLEALYVNHISYQVNDYKRCRPECGWNFVARSPARKGT